MEGIQSKVFVLQLILQSHLTSLSLSFLLYKMEIIKPNSHDCVKHLACRMHLFPSFMAITLTSPREFSLLERFVLSQISPPSVLFEHGLQ